MVATLSTFELCYGLCQIVYIYDYALIAEVFFYWQYFFLCQEQLFRTGKGENNDSSGVLKILGDSSKQGHNPVPSSSSLATGKYTYFRKKKLSRKKVGSVSQCTAPEVDRVLKRPMGRLGDKDTSGIMSKLAEVESVSLHVSDSDKVKVKAETANRAALPGISQSRLRNDRASTKKISKSISRKSNSENQSRILLTSCKIWIPFLKILILHYHESCVCRL